MQTSNIKINFYVFWTADEGLLPGVRGFGVKYVHYSKLSNCVKYTKLTGLLNRTMLFEQKEITFSVFLDNISNDKPMAIPT
jgi:hypothetical protein